MMMSKTKWKWIKFFGRRYVVVFPNKADVYYILYHRRMYDVKSWDKFFKEV